MSIQIHDTKRCPECDQLGIIDEVETRDEYHENRTKKRIYECSDCDVRWEYYV